MQNYTRGIHWESDPSHGWLAVSKEKCKAAGILSKISPFSYYCAGSETIYLEEDRDAGLYLDAIKYKANKEEGETIKDIYRETSFVRILPSFKV